MRINKTIKGETIPYHVKFLIGEMKAEVKFFKRMRLR